MLFSTVLPASVPNPHAIYVSGSAAIPNGADGSINVGDVKEFRFDYQGGAFKLPYDRIISMEITDKAGVKAHLSVLVSWVPKVGKKSGQLLSIRFKGENGAGEAAIFEVSRPEFQPVEPILEARTGKQVQYVDVDQPDNAAAKADQPAPPASPLVRYCFQRARASSGESRPVRFVSSFIGSWCSLGRVPLPRDFRIECCIGRARTDVHRPN